MNYSLLIFLILAVFSCKPKQNISSVQLANDNKIVFADSTAASQMIIVDEREQFFDKITALEMSIQMKKPLSGESRTEVLADYKDFLQKDVENFTKEEREFTEMTMRKALQLCDAVNPDIFPQEIILIKTKGKHYGNSVYYTRENSIVIPENELQARNEEAFLRVMLHEVFHIYSRYNPEKRNDLYELIGFKPLTVRPVLPVALQDRLMTNPDGIDINYVMQMKNAEGDSIEILPIIVSAKDAYSDKTPAFFDYIKFDLYELKYNQNNSYDVLTDEKGFSTLNLRELPDFFDQIEDNTGYIIHPDEILADNFVIVMQEEGKENKYADYSAEGQRLLREVREILVR